jgi:hypothetical protein
LKKGSATAEKDSIQAEAAYKESNDDQTEKYIIEALNSEFNEFRLFNLNDKLKADFNGDGSIDVAKFIKTEKSGITIVLGNSKDSITLGFGNQFAHMTDFNWVEDYWAIVNDSVTFEIIFENDDMSDTLVRLENPSIGLINEEACSGLITYKNGKFIWIHQTD